MKKYFGGVKFDIILYSTPPITFNNVIRYAKKMSGGKAMTYLMLKDIFPQNAVDMGMLSKMALRDFSTGYSERRRRSYTDCLIMSDV